MKNRLKILISAYACEPNKGSEPGVGWEYVKHLTSHVDVWVITRSNNQEVIENELAQTPLHNFNMVYIDLPKWASFWKVGERGMHLYYCLWQIMLFIKVRNLHEKYKFDLVHHLTFGNAWLPTLLPWIRVPFVWGPIGGGEIISKHFTKKFTFKAKVREFIRRSIVYGQWLNPIFRYACRKAVTIISKTEDTAELIPRVYQGKVIQMTDVGISLDFAESKDPNENDDIVQILCVGRLLYWRGFDLAIKSFARIHTELENARLVIIGDGPEKNNLMRIAEKECVSGKIHFAGKISIEQLYHEMKTSSIFLNPCLKEGGVTVLLDAMKYGLPVVCIDTGGVNNIVPDIKIPLLPPDQTISNLANALLKLGKDVELRKKTGQDCRASVQKHTWEKKAQLLYEIYDNSVVS